MRKTGWIPWLLALFLQGSAGLQFTPVALQGSGDGECALIINGPGRSSQFDYNLNLLRGGNGFGYNGQHTCITYDAVNAAYLEARKRVQVAQPHGDYKPEQIATVGELLLDISVNLARTYGLSYEDIEKGLPLIDTSKTLIREVCPPYLSNVECRPGKYRRFDGLCTNLENPTWGATNTPFTRLIGPLYADGMTAPRISVTGNQLPLARVVSRTMHPDEGFHDHAGTVMVIAWGQFIDHDYTLTATPLDPLNRNDPEECCKRPPHLKNPYCNEIPIPEDDYFYRLFNVRCIDFVRGFPAARPGCRLGSRSQFNTLTGVLDANTVYGVTEKFSRKLRSGYGGQLRMNPIFRDYGLKDLLPLKLDIPDEGCTRPNRSMYCFEAGEIRVNEQLVLTCMHTLIAREHNRVAEGLAQVNPHWDDETLFQEARRITIAEVQHITYNEFLPILLGKEVMEKFGLLLQKNGYWDGYDRTVNPNVIDAFAAAAYRFGHSLLPTAVERWSKAHKFIASKRLSDLIRRPYDLYRAGVLDEYFMGLMNQVAQAMDDSITQEVTNHLFKKAGAKFGMDLVSFNMQRGREFGLPGYMEFRKFCGLPGAETFDELFGSMPNDTIKRYSTIFEHPSDVDLWSGGVSERPLPGSMLGPTFACIIATQFSYSRRGDRFWYELPNQPSSFTPEQLQEIRKARLARVICDNTDLIDTIQLYPMVLPDHEINPRVPCRSGVLPTMDFTKWADQHSPIFQQTQHQPFTNNLVDANEVHPTIIKGSLFKEILNSNLYGKHPYESLFNQKTVKKIKILPPLILTTKKEVVPLIRNKRNAEKSQNIPEKSGKTSDFAKEEENEENITLEPIIDQVTEQIIVTEVSGTPKYGSIDNVPLNIKPLVITSSDFQNKTNINPVGDAGINFEEIRDVGKLIQEKLKQISNPDLDYNNEKRRNEEQNDEEEQEKEATVQKEEKQKEIADNSEQDEIQIFVREKEEIEDKKEENIPAESPEIPSSFVQHFLEMSESDPEKLMYSSKKIMDKNDKIKINGEDYSLPKVEQNVEDSEEMKEKNKYFDEIINKQMEENYRLAKELEYPDLDNDYEKYRDYTANEYIHKKIGDFSLASKPFAIKIRGFDPYEQGPSEEKGHNFKDDVDVGTDKERQIDYNNQFQQDDKTFEQTRAALQNDNEDKLSNVQENEEELEKQEEEQQEEQQGEQEEQAKNEENNQQYEEDEEESALIKKYSVMPRKRAQEILKMKDELMKSNEETPSSSSKKYVVKPANFDIKPSGSKPQKRNIFNEQQDFMADLHKMLTKRDSFSRFKNVDNPDEYKNYWSLEYEIPNK